MSAIGRVLNLTGILIALASTIAMLCTHDIELRGALMVPQIAGIALLYIGKALR